MKLTIIRCDSCKKTHDHAKSIGVYIDRRMDGAGSMEDEWATVDLCPDCMARELGTLMNGKSNVIGNHVYGQDWVDRVRK